MCRIVKPNAATLNALFPVFARFLKISLMEDSRDYLVIRGITYLVRITVEVFARLHARTSEARSVFNRERNSCSRKSSLMSPPNANCHRE